MGDELISKAGHQPYPLVEGKVQAEIMAHVRAEVGPVSKARLIEALSSSRGKISAEVARLIEKGLLADKRPRRIRRRTTLAENARWRRASSEIACVRSRFSQASNRSGSRRVGTSRQHRTSVS